MLIIIIEKNARSILRDKTHVFAHTERRKMKTLYIEFESTIGIRRIKGAKLILETLDGDLFSPEGRLVCIGDGMKISDLQDLLRNMVDPPLENE